MNKGEEVITKQVFIEEKSTKPLKRYTQGDLLKAMEGAGKQIDDEILRQQLKGKGLGTVATRPAIIESLIDRGYIFQEQRVLKPTSKGSELIRLIKDRLPKAQLLISAEMTGQMEFNLSKVEKGQRTLEEYISEVEIAIRQIIDELHLFEQQYGRVPLALAPKPPSPRSSKRPETMTRGTGTKKSLVSYSVDRANKEDVKSAMKNQAGALGICPWCGSEVIEGQKGFGCSNWKNGCHFVVWKKQFCGKTITPNQMKSLLKKGKTPLIKGFKSKTGKTFAAYLVWENIKEGKLKLEFKE